MRHDVDDFGARMRELNTVTVDIDTATTEIAIIEAGARKG